MFQTLKKAIFGKNQEQENAKKDSKIEKASLFFNNLFSHLSKELFVTKFKLKNLATANHKLGFKHLKSGNISDATFRFKFIKKFWPQDYDARYALAYCLALKNDFVSARSELSQLQNENPAYADKISSLLVAIALAESNQKIIEFDLSRVIDTDHELEIIFEEEKHEEMVNNEEFLTQNSNTEPSKQDDEEAVIEKSDEESFKKIVKILNEDEK